MQSSANGDGPMPVNPEELVDENVSASVSPGADKHDEALLLALQAEVSSLRERITRLQHDADVLSASPVPPSTDGNRKSGDLAAIAGLGYVAARLFGNLPLDIMVLAFGGGRLLLPRS